MTHSLPIVRYQMNRRRVQRDERFKFQEVMHSTNWFDSKCVGDSGSTSKSEDRQSSQRLGANAFTEWICVIGEGQNYGL